MLGYFIIGVALIVGLIIGANAVAQANPKTIIRAIRIATAIILGVVATFFVFTGRFAYAPPLAAAAIFLLSNRSFLGNRKPSSGNQSDVKTNWIHAVLDHDSGDMDGLVLQGTYKDKNLSDLNARELNNLLEELSDDAQSRSILETYMDRRFSDNEKETNFRQDHANSDETTGSYSQDMSKAEALEVLELDKGATKEEIKAAHKRLMKKFHPDHNGSSYMAAKINQAKDILTKG
ncbi:DnaJ domain-containing protein [Sneathiella sp.]|jgi:hypothetical protein|uniref:DnaJ domain-containing protein n=1 Tax=Sneathiella sp. TaxID=1964365 RepID=UPI0039E6D164